MIHADDSDARPLKLRCSFGVVLSCILPVNKTTTSTASTSGWGARDFKDLSLAFLASYSGDVGVYTAAPASIRL